MLCRNEGFVRACYTSASAPTPAATVAYTYDVYDSEGRHETVVDSRYGTTERVYDPDGQLIRITTPEGTIRYAYDPETGQKTRMWTDRTDIRYAYDALGRLATVTAIELNDTILVTPLVTAYTYDVVGNLVTTAQANGTTESRTYDDLGRLLSVVHTNASSTVLASFVYTLDASGHRVAVDELGGRSVEYTYDALYRLTKEKILQGGVEERVVDYTYDLVGNRLTKTDSAYEWYEYDGFVRYTYDAQDRLVFEDGADYYAGDVTYTYDANGNTLTRADTEHGTTTTYTWDIAGRLVGATIADSSGTQQLTYTYDSDGMRTGATVGGQETTSLIDKQQAYDQVLEEYAPGGALATTYVHGLDLIFQDRQGTRSYYHADGLGSVRALSNAAGAVTDAYTYDAYGQVIGRAGTTANDYQFTGEQYDANLEQTYLRARYYDAAAGRFTSLDAYQGRLYEALTLHKYTYVHNNPTDNTDPSGAMTLVGVTVNIGMVVTFAGAGAAFFHKTGGSALEGAWLGGTSAASLIIAKLEGRLSEAVFAGFVQGLSFAIADVIAQGINRFQQPPDDFNFENLDFHSYNQWTTLQAFTRGFSAGVAGVAFTPEESPIVAALNTTIGSFFSEVTNRGWLNAETWTNAATYTKPILDGIVSGMTAFLVNESLQRSLPIRILERALASAPAQVQAAITTILVASPLAGSIESIFRSVTGRND